MARDLEQGAHGSGRAGQQGLNVVLGLRVVVQGAPAQCSKQVPVEVILTQHMQTIIFYAGLLWLAKACLDFYSNPHNMHPCLYRC